MKSCAVVHIVFVIYTIVHVLDVLTLKCCIEVHSSTIGMQIMYILYLYMYYNC